jgi:hypothetical protein
MLRQGMDARKTDKNLGNKVPQNGDNHHMGCPTSNNEVRIQRQNIESYCVEKVRTTYLRRHGQ